MGLGGLSATIAQVTSMSMTFEEDMGVEDDLVIPRFADEFDDSVRVQSPPPVSTQLARTLGMPSQRVQIMKASFFDADNDYMQDVSMGKFVLIIFIRKVAQIEIYISFQVLEASSINLCGCLSRLHQEKT
jgi:hypothetical protein